VTGEEVLGELPGDTAPALQPSPGSVPAHCPGRAGAGRWEAGGWQGRGDSPRLIL